MTIQFAPAGNALAAFGRGRATAASTRVLHRRAISCAANDNTFARETCEAEDQILRAALRHFAQSGLGAARSARAHAEAAFFAGDRPGYDWWLAITRTLDRRLAAEAERITTSDRYSPDWPRG